MAAIVYRSAAYVMLLTGDFRLAFDRQPLGFRISRQSDEAGVGIMRPAFDARPHRGASPGDLVIEVDRRRLPQIQSIVDARGAGAFSSGLRRTAAVALQLPVCC